MSNERYRYYRLSPREKKLLLKEMQDILEREGVTLAIVFGSFLELESFRDIDVAIYERGLGLKDISRISAKLERELKIPVDVVPLDRLPSKFRHQVLTKGRIILDKTPGLYETILIQAIDEVIIMERPL